MWRSSIEAIRFCGRRHKSIHVTAKIYAIFCGMKWQTHEMKDRISTHDIIALLCGTQSNSQSLLDFIMLCRWKQGDIPNSFVKMSTVILWVMEAICHFLRSKNFAWVTFPFNHSTYAWRNGVLCISTSLQACLHDTNKDGNMRCYWARFR